MKKKKKRKLKLSVRWYEFILRFDSFLMSRETEGSQNGICCMSFKERAEGAY